MRISPDREKRTGDDIYMTSQVLGHLKLDDTPVFFKNTSSYRLVSCHVHASFDTVSRLRLSWAWYPGVDPQTRTGPELHVNQISRCIMVINCMLLLLLLLLLLWDTERSLFLKISQSFLHFPELPKFLKIIPEICF